MKRPLLERFFLLFILLFSLAKFGFTQTKDSIVSVQDTDSTIVVPDNSFHGNDSITTMQDSIYSGIDTSDYFPGDKSFNLIIAAEKGYDEEILKLLKKGADINTTTSDGVTPLMYAVQNDHLNVAKILLLNGADPNIKPYKRPPALIVAVSNISFDISELLIRKGADINIQDNNGRTALMHASANGSIQIVDLLLYYERNYQEE